MIKITITLELANKRDFVDLVSLKPVKKYKIRIGVPYWLYNSKGEIEPNNYITSERTTFEELSNYFSRKQILTIKKQ